MATYIKKKYYGIDETVRILKVKGAIISLPTLCSVVLTFKSNHIKGPRINNLCRLRPVWY